MRLVHIPGFHMPQFSTQTSQVQRLMMFLPPWTETVKKVPRERTGYKTEQLKRERERHTHTHMEM